MDKIHHALPLLTLLAGAFVVLAILMKEAARRIGVSAISAFLLFGVALRLLAWRGGLTVPVGRELLAFLGNLGIFALLFRVGLKSDLPSLVDYLRRATPIWVGNVFVSGAVGFATAYWVLGFEPLPSLFCAVAMTASSVGVAVAAWEEAGALDSEGGNLLIDVAEMDDISGVVAMGLLLAVAVPLHHGQSDGILTILGSTAALFGLKLVGFAAACYAFSRWVEPAMTRWFESFEHRPDPMLSVVGVAAIIAATAGLIGFSVAIGAFMAGLTFSRDPDAVEMDADFQTLYDVFTPFFFIHLGFTVSPDHLAGAGSAAVILLVAAVLGKWLGTVLGGLASTDYATASLLGISLMPRAEIALVILAEGQMLGTWAVPPALFSGMVIVSIFTCTGVPLVLRDRLEQRAD